ncbi:hypothetical protein DPMN_164683 [Dreissena polymorpha]|uniref:Uncharacterized protein n=1 Tax=Dreissena polymorpha TaxID=45954 RepID=A0A9D4ISK1_DREPO|nr:hypothetical protein DPMN_164683 [Dreissena polymorpha]
MTTMMTKRVAVTFPWTTMSQSPLPGARIPSHILRTHRKFTSNDIKFNTDLFEGDGIENEHYFGSRVVSAEL